MRYAVISTSLTILQLQDEVKKHGGRNLKVATASKQIFCDLDDTGAAKLKALGCSITKIGGVKATVMPPVIAPPTPVAAAPVYSPEELVWAAGLEELRAITEPPLYGEDFNLAIIDSGIRETHQKINGRVIYRKNYTAAEMRDGYDHGTGICSVALAVAPLANILNMKVLDDKGEGTEEDVALAIDDCIALQDTNPSIAPTIINLSLGGPDDGNPNDPLRVACRAAIEREIWVIASAGNGGPLPYSITSPACERYVFAVGSVKFLPEESTFILSDWSSRGPTMEGLIKPDALMFGEDVVMASSASDSATIAKSGTSFATPIISGIGILYREGVYRLVELPGVIPPGVILAGQRLVPIDEILDDYMVNMCLKPQGIALGKDNDYGCGLVWGPLVYGAIIARPALDISTIMGGIMPLIGLAMLGMVMVPMLKGEK